MAKQIIDSVGIEMEFMNINRTDPRFISRIRTNLRNYKLGHDASCETPIFAIGNHEITLDTKKARQLLENLTNKIVIGGELASPIIDTISPDWILEIHKLCSILKEYGEIEDTPRASFHVHINLSREAPLYVILNLLKLTLEYEAILFRLGGMGRRQRGEQNQYAYCRPYLGNGPPVINIRTINYPILNPKDLLESTSIQQFFTRYGNAYHLAENGAKYITPRYMSVNFYPILTQGSLEFRTANKTLNPRYIIAWTNFCKAIVKRAFSTSDIQLIDPLPLADNKTISTREFIYRIETLNLDEATLNTLIEIWETSPTPIFDNKWMYSHLEEPTRLDPEIYAPTPLPKKTKIVEPKIIDVRNAERNNDPDHENDVEKFLNENPDIDDEQ